jgi:hypothetical protein
MDPYLFQDGPNFPLTEEDTDWGDYPDDASNISKDSDEDGYPVQRVSNIVEWNEDVFKDIEVPSTIIVDENPWCFQCSEAHWEHECPYSNGGHQQVNNIGHISKDSDEDGYPVQRVSNIVEWNEDVFKDIEVPSTIIVDENPWCFQCSEAHWENECPYSNGGHQQVNNIGHIIEGPQINVTAEEHQEAIKEAARSARMAVINKLDQELKERLNKQEFQVYRRKKLNQPVADQTKNPPLAVIFPKTSKTERVNLNFDFAGALSKMLVTIPLKEVIKVPSLKERFDNFLRGSHGPLKDETIGRLQNIPVTTTHMQEPSDSNKDDKARDKTKQTSHKYSPEDTPFATKEDFDQIQRSTKEKYLQLIDRYKDREVGTISEDDVRICPSQQEIFIAESHPPPSTKYTRVVQGTTKFKVREYNEGDIVWMWDANKGKPTNIKGNDHFWLGPFKVGRKSVNDSYYLSTLEGRRRTMPISGHLLKPH